MTPEDIRRVVETAPLVHEDTDLVARFYAVLFERHPELRELFPADMTEQHHRFVTEIEAFARAMPDLREVETQASQLGSRHARYGVRSFHYPFVRDALLDVLDERLGDTFTLGHRAAWARAFNLFSEIMMESRPPAQVE
jgi:hemoglobin-like flavoprotein